MAQDIVPCDPASWDQPVQRAMPSRCGNGRIDALAGRCFRRCSGGCGASNCRVNVAVERGDARPLQFALLDRGDGAVLDLDLPGGARLTLTQQGDRYDDRYLDARGAAPLGLAGSLPPPRPPTEAFVEGYGMSSVAYARRDADTIAAAVFAPSRPARPRLMLATVRAP